MKNDGGPAFPSEQGELADETWNQTYHPGMTLRQWYAGLAMQGMLANNDLLEQATQIGDSDQVIAEWAFSQADAMLRAEGGDDDA